MKTTWYFLPVMICLVLCACQAPVLLSTVGSSSLKMTFLVSGSRDTTLPSAKVAASGSRLLLPTIVSLTVSLSPQDPSLPAIAPKTQTFPAGTVPNQITMVFPNVANGTYTISAEATDNSNNTFRQTSLTNIGENTSSVTLNLIPTNSTGLTQLSFGPTYSGSLTTLQSISFTVPASSLTTSLGKFVLRLSAPSAVLCFIQNSDGTNLSPTSSDRTFSATVSDFAFVTLYNSSNSVDAQAYSFVLSTPSGSGDWTTDQPATNTIAISGAINAYYGNPTTFTASYSGYPQPSATSFSWYIDGQQIPSSQVASSATSSFATFLPTSTNLTLGAHSLMVTAKDANSGILYSANENISIANNLPSSSGLVGEWLFSGNANDTSGNGYTGTVAGAVLSSDRKGKVNSGYYFSSGSSIATATGDTALQFIHTDAFSVSVWINAESSTLSSSGWPYVLSQIGTSGQFNYFIDFSSGSIAANVGINSSGSANAGTPLTTGWHHIVLVYSPHSVSLYSDGIFQSNQTLNPSYFGSTPASGTGFYFGGGESNLFAGWIDDCRVYNRALSASEITALYRE